MFIPICQLTFWCIRCRDICSYEGKVKLIATGFGEAPTAVNNALHYLRPDARRQPVHSTSLFENGVPK